MRLLGTVKVMVNPQDVFALLESALDPQEPVLLDDALAHVELLDSLVASTPGLLLATREAARTSSLNARLALSARQHARLVGPVLESLERLLEPEAALVAEADAMLVPEESLSVVVSAHLDASGHAPDELERSMGAGPAGAA